MQSTAKQDVKDFSKRVFGRFRSKKQDNVSYCPASRSLMCSTGGQRCPRTSRATAVTSLAFFLTLTLFLQQCRYFQRINHVGLLGKTFGSRVHSGRSARGPAVSVTDVQPEVTEEPGSRHLQDEHEAIGSLVDR